MQDREIDHFQPNFVETEVAEDAPDGHKWSAAKMYFVTSLNAKNVIAGKCQNTLSQLHQMPGRPLYLLLPHRSRRMHLLCNRLKASSVLRLKEAFCNRNSHQFSPQH